MLVFKNKDKYDSNEQSDLSCTSSVQEKPFPSIDIIKKRNRKKKLSKTNIQFLKSLGFKIKPQQ